MQRRREAAEERLRERGLMPSVADLEAYQRVETNGLALFHELSGELAGQLAQRLRVNETLKEGLEQLHEVQKRLDTSNTKVVEQEKQLERRPKAEQEKDEAPRFMLEVEDEARRMRTQVEELAKDNKESEDRYGKATAEGFQRRWTWHFSWLLMSTSSTSLAITISEKGRPGWETIWSTILSSTSKRPRMMRTRARGTELRAEMPRGHL